MLMVYKTSNCTNAIIRASTNGLIRPNIAMTNDIVVAD